MAEQFKKINDNRYKMVKVIADCRGPALVVEWPETYSKVTVMTMTTAMVTRKISNLNEMCMNFGMVMTESHSCKKGLPIYYTYGTWPTNTTFEMP